MGGAAAARCPASPGPGRALRLRGHGGRALGVLRAAQPRPRGPGGAEVRPRGGGGAGGGGDVSSVYFLVLAVTKVFDL